MWPCRWEWGAGACVGGGGEEGLAIGARAVRATAHPTLIDSPLSLLQAYSVPPLRWVCMRWRLNGRVLWTSWRPLPASMGLPFTVSDGARGSDPTKTLAHLPICTASVLLPQACPGTKAP